MNTNNKDDFGTASVSKYDNKIKIIVSMIAGLLGLFFSQFSISIDSGLITIDINWALIIPAVASLAYGAPYALIAGISGGAVFPFLLWANNGWSNVLSSSIILVYLIVISRRSKKTNSYSFDYFKTGLGLTFVIGLLFVSYLYLFQPLLNLNPPFWTHNAITSLPTNLVRQFAIKDTLLFIIIYIAGGILLKLPVIRKIFGLTISDNMKNNTKIFSATILASLLIWICLAIFNETLFAENSNIALARHAISLLVILFGGLLVGNVLISYFEKRMLAENALRESENRLKIINENTPDNLLQVNKDGIITYINKTVSGLNIEQVIGTSVFNWIPEDYKSIVEQGLNSAFIKGESYDYESPGPSPDDLPRFYHVRITPVINNGIVDSAIYITTDITERKIAKEKLQKSLDRNQALLDANPDIMLVYLEDGTIIDYNSSNLDDLYAAPEKFIGKNVADILPENIASLTKQNLQLVKQNGGYSLYKYSLDINGEKYFESRMVKCGAGEYLSIIRNITEQVRYETALSESERKFKSLFELPLIGATIIGISGNWLAFNDKFCEIVGYSREELLNKTWFEMTPEEELERELNTYRNIISGQQDSQEIDKRFIHKSGELIDVHISAICVKTAAGEPDYFVSYIQDITQRKKAEQELKASEMSYISLFNSMSEAIYILTPDGYFLDVNDGALAMYDGYNKTDFIGNTPEFVSAKGLTDLNKVGEIIQEVFQTGKSKLFEFWGRKKTGLVFPKELIANKGQYFGLDVVIITARDISERKQAEAMLKESEERYRAISENSHAAICIVNADAKITWCNDKMIEISGYSKEQIYSTDSFLVFLSPESIPFVSSNFMKFVNRQDYVKKYSFMFIRADCEIRECEKHMMDFTNIKGERALVISMNDVTEARKAERTLIENEHFIKNITENTPDIIYIYDTQERRNLYLNRSISEYLGYHQVEFPDTETDFYDKVIHPDDFAQFDDYYQNLDNWPENSLVIFEYRMKTKLGDWKWFKDTEKEFRRENGKVVKLIGTLQEITKIKRAELMNKIRYKIANAVVNSKNLNDLYVSIKTELNSIIDASNLYIAIFNPETGMLTSNIEKDELDDINVWPANKSLTGYLIERETTLFLKKSEILSLIENDEIIQIGSLPELFLGATLKVDGKAYGALVMQNYTNPSAYNNEDLEIIEWVANELSIFIEMKNSEEKSAKLSKAVIQSPNSVIITDIDGIVEYVNPKFSAVSGYSYEEIIGKKSNIIKSGLHGVEIYNELWDTILSGKEWRGEIINKKKTGDLYREDVSIAPIFNDTGKITHFIGVKEDITERFELIQELIEAKNRAEESDILKSAFLANMSHEIRTPMNAILGFAHLLDSIDLTDEEKREYIHFINKRGNDLLKIINDILDISKIEANQLNLYYSQCDINALLDEIYAIHSVNDEFLDTKAVRLLIGKRPPGSTTSLMDYARLQQILNNLVGNALKFTEHGYVEFGCSLVENELHFYVKDTGIGIEPDKINIVFERFRQADDNHLNRKYEGTGLGLSICKGLVDLMSGNIWVESEQNSGTTFFFTLPFKSIKEESKSSEIKSKPVFYWLDKKVLIVEDDKPNAILIEKYLKSTGIQSIIAYSGKAALNAINENPDIDLILMDVQLPDINGYEVTKRIHEIIPDIYVIAQTAHAFDEDKIKALNAGCCDYISKPINKDGLLTIMDKYLST